MSTLNPKRRKIILPYWASMAAWLFFGPLGAGPASCGRWGRACLEAALSLGAMRLLGDAMLFAGDPDAFANALTSGEISPARALAAAGLLCLSLGLWISDYWRIQLWHGRKADPLLDPSTLAE
jgi:hypothetical protein